MSLALIRRTEMLAKENSENVSANKKKVKKNKNNFTANVVIQCPNVSLSRSPPLFVCVPGYSGPAPLCHPRKAIRSFSFSVELTVAWISSQIFIYIAIAQLPRRSLGFSCFSSTSAGCSGTVRGDPGCLVSAVGHLQMSHPITLPHVVY